MFLDVSIYISSLRQKWRKANSYFNVLNILNLISLMRCFRKPEPCSPPDSFCLAKTLLLSRDSLYTVKINNDQWSCSLSSKTSLTPLPLRHDADSWVLIWKLGTENQGSGNHKGWEGESKGGWKEERERETKARELFVVVFAIVNPFELGTEIPHINMHCIIPSSEANCFCKLALSWKRHTDEGYWVNVK